MRLFWTSLTDIEQPTCFYYFIEDMIVRVPSGVGLDFNEDNRAHGSVLNLPGTNVVLSVELAM